MNAKQLIDAAKASIELVEMLNIVDNIKRWYAIAPHAETLARHVMETVCPDDDESVTREKMLTEVGWEEIEADVFRGFRRTVRITELGAEMSYPFAELKSLGHLRRLVAALGEK